MTIRDKKDKDDTIDDVSAYQGQSRRKDFRLDWTNYRHWTEEETLDKPWGNYRQTL